jgi:microcystin-dependent protein
MSTQFVSEIRMFGGNFAPFGWAFCNGQALSVNDNQVLFVLIGTTYGGDGINTFNVPDLRGRFPIHNGTGPGLSTYVLGQAAGTEQVGLTTTTMPQHSHTLQASTTLATLTSPTNNVLGQGPILPPSAPTFLYRTNAAPAPTLGSLQSNSVGPAGNSIPHDNIMPFLCVNFIIALQGVFPSQN